MKILAGMIGTCMLAGLVLQNPALSPGFGYNPGPAPELIYLHKIPYLIYTGNNTEMEVIWQTYVICPGYVAWGTDTAYSLGNEPASEYGTDHQYKYTITGLAPSAKYYFRVIAGTDTVTGNFRAAPAEGATETELFVYGDTRSNPNFHDSVAKRIVMNYAADPEAQTIALLSGDLVSDGNVESKWDEQFFSADYSDIRELFRTVPIISSKGNHEGTGLIFKKYFPYPYVTSSRFYWSFDYGPVHVCIIDQDTTYAPGSAQYEWIATDLASSAKPWKFLLFHDPGWSAGGGHSNDADVQEILQPLCLEYGVQFVFNGHNHYYSRAEVSGIEHITTGGGGAPLHTPDPGDPFIVATSSSHHFCKIHIDTDTLYFTAIMDNGTVIESFSYHNYYEWTGAIDQDWGNSSNWSKGMIPGENWNVLIPPGLSNYPRLYGSGSCKNIRIEEGSSLTIMNGGTLNITGKIENRGTLDVNEGAIVIPGSEF